MQAQRRLDVFLGHIQGASPAPRPTALAAESCAARRRFERKADVRLVFSNEVSQALRAGKPVVALESTIISHGMPYPQNLKTANEVEKVVRANGAVPATIALLNGEVRIGLDAEALETLARLGPKCRKCSRRDLPVVVAEKGNGATTVAATMYLAHLAGIRVFVTGGIGGVHRGAEQTMDISADIMELGRTPVAVVCAGVKSILDIPKTLEALETQGVSVVSVGTKKFPAFFTPDSGSLSPFWVDTPEQGAKVIMGNKLLNLQSGMLFAVPIPEREAANAAHITKAIDQALKEADEQKVTGKDSTPFLLKRVNELSGGESLQSNIALVKNNAKFGAKLALEYAKLAN